MRQDRDGPSRDQVRGPCPVCGESVSLRCFRQMAGPEVWWVGTCDACASEIIGETPQALRVRTEAPAIDWSFDYGEDGSGAPRLGTGNQDSPEEA